MEGFEDLGDAYYKELTNAAATKLGSDEVLMSLVQDSAIVDPKLGPSRFLVTVCNDAESALFVMLKSSPTLLDLSIVQVLPIDNNFICLMESDSLLRLSITSHKTRLKCELKFGLYTESFIDILFRAIDRAKNVENQEFAWICKYVTDITYMELFKSHKRDRDFDIQTQMLEKESEYTSFKTLLLFIGTWNVNGRCPPVSLARWLATSPSPPDIYAVGFQELDLSKEALLVNNNLIVKEWEAAINESVDPRERYKQVCLVRLVGMLLVVLVKEKYSKHIKNIETCTVGTGILGKMGNKGGVSIRFELHNTSICFVNSHLAAHVEEFERRNRDYHDIHSRTQFPYSPEPIGINNHDQIYWLGDLNYRITEMDHFTVKRHLKELNFETVLKADQLKTQHSSGKVLDGYSEGQINFQPTYKYDPGTDDWDSSEKSRAPAWCDRIFWRGTSIQQLKYQSHPELNISDHKPVSALFESIIKIVDDAKYKKAHMEVNKNLDRIENEYLPDVTVEPQEIVFGTIKYYEREAREVRISNKGQFPVKFEFIKKNNESSYCKSWLNVTPKGQTIGAAERCIVKLEIFVNKESAAELNQKSELSDILVLHLEGGKDIFLTVTGVYETSCFGSSIETLIRYKAPMSYKCRGNVKSFHSDNEYYVPKELWYLINHIYKHGLKSQNLFKLNRKFNFDLLPIRDWLDCGSQTEIPGSIHSVVDALLLFLDSMNEPIIPYRDYNSCIDASVNYLRCKEIIKQLPVSRKNSFLYICLFLQEVLHYCTDNGTDPLLLAKLFGPILLKNSPQNKSELNYNEKKIVFVHHFLVNDEIDTLYK